MKIRRLPTRPRGRTAGGAEGERGQIIVLFAGAIVVILLSIALVVDIGLLRNDRQGLANAMDAGALAGGTLLPVDGSQGGAAATVNALINQTVQATNPGLSSGDYNISYRCLIGTDAGNAGAFDAADIDAFIPLDCDPRHALGHFPPTLGDFIGAGTTRSSVCRPDLGDKCNVVVVDGNVTTPYSFARVVGINSGDTGVVTSAACRGLCGELPTVDLDVVLILDNSTSMGPSSGTTGTPPRTRIGWAKVASNELINSLAATHGTQQVGAVQYSSPSCASNPNPVTSATAIAPLAGDFAAVRAGIATLLGDGGCTPLKYGMVRGVDVMSANERAGATQVLIILSDGRPWPDNANSRPNAAEVSAFRAAADEVYSIAIGLSGTGAANPDTPLMTSLSKPNDGTHFFQVDTGSGLLDVFRQIAVELTTPRSHLIKVYPAPIVTGVGGGANVSISGKYFTGATRVTFGGTSAAFTVNSDTSITAAAPSGTPGQTVHVRVTTPGGSSPAVPADEYTYP